MEEAKNIFKEIYKEKTGNIWEEKNKFKRIKGKYDIYIYNKVKLIIKNFLEPFDYNKCLNPSMIKDEGLIDLFKEMSDISILNNYYKNIDIDDEIVPLSCLNKEMILKGKNLL